MLGGQIGSGKSTMINRLLEIGHQQPDVVLHFDLESLNLDTGDFWGITLAGLLDRAIRCGIDLSFCALPNELGRREPNDWKGLLQDMVPTRLSMKAFSRRSSVFRKIGRNASYVHQVVNEIGIRLEDKLARPLFVLASGLDKFNTAGSAFITMQDPIRSILRFKTLLEVNAVHLFTAPGSPLHQVDRLFVPTASSIAVIKILAKRMGAYKQSISDELYTIAEWSGGNLRQAVRILTHFGAAKRRRNCRSAECLLQAVRATKRDFFAFSRSPSKDLMAVVAKTGVLNSSLLGLPGDKETARQAVYDNWLLLGSHKEGSTWGAVVNPLVSGEFLQPSTLEDEESRLLGLYATTQGISSVGLGPSRDYEDEKGNRSVKSGEHIKWELFRAGVEQPIETSLAEIFDVLASALLSKDRVDRAIIAYKEQRVVEAARSYLFAKSNSYEYQTCSHTVIEGGKGKHPLRDLRDFLSTKADVFSIAFEGKWSVQQLESIDRQRDMFLEFQMLWWVSMDQLKQFLPCWVNLRQLFEVFVIEDELLQSLSAEEIEADIAYFEELRNWNPASKESVITNLKFVLEHLKSIRNSNVHA
ncbi:MAG: hypothetical protein A4E65_00074 [Syntrophorhabdus sp. PtaU1.Bin153]|nr:MAG: hypothetical protein A4E65_00074 [Syntrophorhabdus sp. PtaU1.Bin153]